MQQKRRQIGGSCPKTERHGQSQAHANGSITRQRQGEVTRRVRTRVGLSFALLLGATQTKANSDGETGKVFAFKSLDACLPTPNDFSYEHVNFKHA